MFSAPQLGQRQVFESCRMEEQVSHASPDLVFSSMDFS
jgi:hypothetical protein